MALAKLISNLATCRVRVSKPLNLLGEFHMKAKLASLVAVPLLALSSFSFAQDIVQPAPAEPMMLSLGEMDGITAGYFKIDVDNSIINVNFGHQNIGNIGGWGGVGKKVFYINVPL
jgi:hypothetical protein